MAPPPSMKTPDLAYKRHHLTTLQPSLPSSLSFLHPCPFLPSSYSLPSNIHLPIPAHYYFFLHHTLSLHFFPPIHYLYMHLLTYTFFIPPPSHSFHLLPSRSLPPFPYLDILPPLPLPHTHTYTQPANEVQGGKSVLKK